MITPSLFRARGSISTACSIRSCRRAIFRIYLVIAPRHSRKGISQVETRYLISPALDSGGLLTKHTLSVADFFDGGAFLVPLPLVAREIQRWLGNYEDHIGRVRVAQEVRSYVKFLPVPQWMLSGL